MDTTVGYTDRSDMTRTRTTKKSAAAALIGRLGGKAGTSKQNDARKRNAQLAGRPRRVCNVCGEPVKGHLNIALDEACGQHGWHWQKKHERVAAVNGPKLAHVVLTREEVAALIVALGPIDAQQHDVVKSALSKLWAV